MQRNRLSSYKITLLHQFYSAFLTVILLNDTCLKYYNDKAQTMNYFALI